MKTGVTCKSPLAVFFFVSTHRKMLDLSAKNKNKMIFLFSFIWLLEANILFIPVQGQSWSISTATFPSTSGFSGQTDIRIYGNVFAALTGSSTAGTIFCSYYNGVIQVCQNSGVQCNTGHFYAPDPDNTIYFYCTVMNYALGTVTSQISIMTVTVSSTAISSTVLTTLTVSENAGALDLDWNHRWMVVSGTSRLHLYDIKNPRLPVLVDSFLTALQTSHTGHPRGISIWKNLICSSWGFCIRLNPSTGKFIPSVVGTMATSRSLRIFDDYIIQWNTKLQVYDLNFNLIGSSAVTFGGLLDAIRSKDVVFVTELMILNVVSVCVFNISNPSSMQTVACSSMSGFSAMFLDQYSIYASNWNGYNSAVGTKKVTLNVPYGYDKFYRDSEWFNYALTVNTLAVSQNTDMTFFYRTLYSKNISLVVLDTYTQQNLIVWYNITQLPTDYSVDKWMSGTWQSLPRFSVFSQTEINSNLVRLRYLNLNFPLQRNLNQTLVLMTDNTRGSQLLVNVSLSFLYGSGNQCPLNAVCTMTSFQCNPGYTLDLTGTMCSPCANGTYRSNMGTTSCIVCPSNSVCNAGSSMFQCVPGYYVDGLTCSLCPKESYQPTISSATSCSSCPANSECPSTGMTLFSCAAGYTLNTQTGNSCSVCSAGSYKSTSGNVACTNCPVNSDCNSVATTMFSCVAGYTLDQTSNGCTACPSGYYKSESGNSQCVSCPTNSQCSGTGLTVFSCNPGYTTTDGDRTGCKPCSAGTFKSQSGNQICSICPSNANCPTGSLFFTCLAGYTLSVDQASCASCAATNSYKLAAGNDACTACPEHAVCSTGTGFTCQQSYLWNSTTSKCQSNPNAGQPTSPEPGTSIFSMILQSQLYLGISIGVISLIILLLCILIAVWWRRRKARKMSYNTTALPTTTTTTTTTGYTNMSGVSGSSTTSGYRTQSRYSTTQNQSRLTTVSRIRAESLGNGQTTRLNSPRSGQRSRPASFASAN